MTESQDHTRIPSGGVSASLAIQGRWLFRWRSFLPLAAFPILISDFFISDDRTLAPGLTRIVAALILVALGQALRILVSGTARAGSSGRNTRRIRAYELETTGAYSLCRNPVYLGNLLMTLGVLSFTGSPHLIFVTILSFWLYYERIIAAEEALLYENFGADYEAFASSRPVFIPRLRGWQAPYQAFSWKAALRREYTTVAAAAVFASALLTARELAYTKTLTLQPWHTLTGAILIVYLLLRTIKKTTRFMRQDREDSPQQDGDSASKNAQAPEAKTPADQPELKKKTVDSKAPASEPINSDEDKLSTPAEKLSEEPAVSESPSAALENASS